MSGSLYEQTFPEMAKRARTSDSRLACRFSFKTSLPLLELRCAAPDNTFGDYGSVGGRAPESGVPRRDRRQEGVAPREAGPLVDQSLFDAAQRSDTPGKRRGRDVLSGKVRCGLCQRVASVGYNARNQPIYRCRHRGQGCSIPVQSARGLQRAARLGISRVCSESW